MAKATLLQAACAAAMLAATPVLAQTNTPTGDTGAGGAPNAPASHEATPGSHMTGHMHHSMGEHHAKSSSSANAQDAAVDRLNDQSYQAAQKGESFDGGAPASSGGGDSSGGAAPPPGKM